MRKLGKKILAVCLSAVMAGTLLTVSAFAAQSEADPCEENEIITLASATATVIKKDKTKTDWEFSGDVYVQKDVTLTVSGTSTITGDVYVFGTLINLGELTITGTIHCLHYNDVASAGDYDYGYFINSGTLSASVLNVTSGYLDTEIPDTDDDDDDDDDDEDSSGSESGGGTTSVIHSTVIDGDETYTDRVITGNIYIPKGSSLTTSGDVTVNGNVYVLGTLTNTGTLTITGTIYCLHFGSLAAAGNYDYGYVYNRSVLYANTMIVKSSLLSISFPTSTVHTWDSGEVIKEATCTEPGEMLYVCTGCGETKTEEIPAAHSWGEVEWTWNEDHSSATASRTCKNCGLEETLDATVTSETTEPTETKDGSIVYTAIVTLEDGSELTTTYDEIIPATGQEDSNSSGSGSSNSGSSSSGSSGSGSSGSGSSGSDSSDSGSSGSDSSSSDSSDSGSSGNNSSNNGSSGSGYSGSGSSGNGSSGSGSSGSSGSSTYSPQTDDPTNMTALWLIVAGFGLAGCAVLVLYKVRGIKVRN